MSDTPAQETGSSVAAVGAGLGRAVRVLRTGGKDSRLTRGLFAGGQAFLASVGHAAHMLWLEVTGFIFACFAIIGSFALFREYRAYKLTGAGQNRMATTAIFAVVFGWFALSSFWRARKR